MKRVKEMAHTTTKEIQIRKAPSCYHTGEKELPIEEGKK
jgi:hypothetical protein